MKKPDFMTIGAPKCGTTALCQYLASHPDICFSNSKEPNFFCSDFPDYCNSFTENEYLEKEFGHCKDSDRSIGEGSVWYLYSRVAIKRIIQFNPHTKFIVMLRNPVDAAQALHSQMLNNLDEDIADFKTAWLLQDRRKNNEDIPPLCREASFLQYREVVKFGVQTQHLLQLVPRDQVRIIFFEDFSHHTRKVYQTTLEFLGLEDDGQSHFPRINENRQVQSRGIARLAHRPPQLVKTATRHLKRLTGIQRFGLSRLVASLGDRFNTRTASRPLLDKDFQATIIEELVDDIVLLEELTGNDLGRWKTVQSQ